MLICTANALAADLPARTYTKAPVVVSPAYNWTGFYVGAHLGYGWEDNLMDVTTLPKSRSVQRSAVFVQQQAKRHFGRPAGRIQLAGRKIRFRCRSRHLGNGHPWQQHVRSHYYLRAGAGSFCHKLADEHPADGLVRNASWALGFTPVDRLLVYATGGLAYGHVEATAFQEIVAGLPILQFTGAESVTRLGWTVGAGGEWAIGNNWSIKGEYLYSIWAAIR